MDKGQRLFQLGATIRDQKESYAKACWRLGFAHAEHGLADQPPSWVTEPEAVSCYHEGHALWTLIYGGQSGY